MQLRLLAMLLLQAERSWTLHELVQALNAPQSSVHRELGRAEATGIVRRDVTSRPHRYRAATDEPLYEPLATLLSRSVGVEADLKSALESAGVLAAVIHGSWASTARRPDSDIDVLVVSDADLRQLRRLVRPIGKTAGRTIDLTVMTADEFHDLAANQSGFVRRVLESPMTPLVGDLISIADRDGRTH